MKSFFPRKTQKARKTLNNLLCVATHTLLNRKANFEPYGAKLHFLWCSNSCVYWAEWLPLCRIYVATSAKKVMIYSLASL